MALKNTTARSCTLGGYPGLLLLNSAGAGLPTKVVRKGSYGFTAMAPTTVTVAPGNAAYFNIGYSDVPVGGETSCPTSAVARGHPPQPDRPSDGEGHHGPVWRGHAGGVARLPVDRVEQPDHRTVDGLGGIAVSPTGPPAPDP